MSSAAYVIAQSSQVPIIECCVSLGDIEGYHRGEKRLEGVGIYANATRVSQCFREVSSLV